MYILLVEDNEAERKLVIRALERLGHTVIWSADGERALDLMAIEPVQLVLLDLMLGAGIDGWEVARRKAEMPVAAHIPVIITSGMSLETIHARDQSPLAGAMLVIGKPIDLVRLERAIALIEHPPSDTEGHQAKDG